MFNQASPYKKRAYAPTGRHAITTIWKSTASGAVVCHTPGVLDYHGKAYEWNFFVYVTTPLSLTSIDIDLQAD